MHVQIKQSLAHLQDLILTLTGVFCISYVLIPAKKGLNFVDVLENALFLHVFGFEL